MQRLKVWLFTSEFPPMYGGGISTYCWEACLAWSESGHDVTVFTRPSINRENVEVRQIREGITLCEVPVRASAGVEASLGYWHLMSYCLARAAVERIQSIGQVPDLIEVQDYGGLGYFLLKQQVCGTPELSNVPVVVYCHTPVFELCGINQESAFLFPNYAIGKAEKFTLRAANSVVSPSKFLAKRIEQYCSSPVQVIPYPYFGESEPQVGALQKIDTQFDCVYVGRLEYRKGVVQLLEAMSKLWDRQHKITLRLVGGDTHWAPKQLGMKEYLQRRFGKYVDLGLLTFSDPVPPDSLPSVFASARITIIPSLYENFPYVCMQSMDLARAILVSSSGGHAELLGEEKAQFVFDWSKCDDFQMKLVALLQHTKAELNSIGAENRRRLKSLCSSKKFVEARIANLTRIISQNKIGQITSYPFAHASSRGTNKVEHQVQLQRKKGMVSVVIPFFNLGKFLAETLASVRASSYANLEIIIVNDGCTEEESIQLLDTIRTTDSSIRIIDIENAGLANARNVGARESTGEFVAFLDADDLIEEDYYAKCTHVLNAYQNVSFVYSWVKYFDGSDGLWVNFDTEFPYFLAANCLAAFQVVRATDFLCIGQNNPELVFGMEDYEAWLRMAANGYQGVSLPEPLVKYRVRANSMARQFKRPTVIYMYEQMVRLNPAIYKQYGDELFQLVNANGPGYLWNNSTLSYPQIGHVAQIALPVINEAAPAFAELTPQEVYRLKRLFMRPFIQKIAKSYLALSRKLHHG